MEHVVFYPSSEGVPAFERVGSLDEAVSFVEQLRNSFNITEFSVQALTPVPLSFRAYYHVEVPDRAGAVASADASAGGSSQPAQALDEDRSAAWVAEASIAEPPAPETSPERQQDAVTSAWEGSFADASLGSPPDADGTAEAALEPAAIVTDVVPEPGSHKSLGFFTR
jgi:hypothetical protein